MVTVRVRLFATLRRYRPEQAMGEALPVTLPHGATVKDVTAHLGVPDAEVRLIFVNGLYGGLGQVLADGDELGIFPPVGGG